jgi:hypothetical protein
MVPLVNDIELNRYPVARGNASRTGFDAIRASAAGRYPDGIGSIDVAMMQRQRSSYRDQVTGQYGHLDDRQRMTHEHPTD